MSRFFVQSEQIAEDVITIIGNDVNHLKNVLRKKNGDIIEICNIENKVNYKCEIINTNNEKIEAKIIEKEESERDNIKITIMQGIPKFDKMELVIQKSVELGVYEIAPIEMERCVVKLKNNDKLKKIDRWQKISEVAAKQCMQNYIPKINEILSIKELCNKINEYDAFLVAYENEKENTLKEVITNLKIKKSENLNIAILIGPEGGISEQEINLLKKSGAKVITLGKRILRTETVALNVLSIFKYEFEG